MKKICDSLRIATQANQWKDITECISWFHKINNKNRYLFIKYVKNFYQSISQNGLLEALHFTKGFVNIAPDQMEIILHCRKSILFHNGATWFKKKIDCFDVPQGSFVGAEISELIGLHILYEINKVVHINNHGLYRDDSLMIVPINRTNDIIRKALFKLFKSLDLK